MRSTLRTAPLNHVRAEVTSAIGLRLGRLRDLDAGSIGLVNISDGHNDAPPEVVVFVKDDGERDFTLHPGDTFPIGDQTWVLDRVTDPGGNRLTAVFIRIE